MSHFELSGAYPTGLQATLLLAAASDMLLSLDPRGRITYASPASEQVLGYPPEEMVGRLAFDFLVPADQAHWQEHHQHVMAPTGPDESRQLTHNLRRDGTDCWLENYARILRQPATGEVQAIHIVVRDVTDRVRMELQLREQHALLEALFELSPTGIFVLRAERDGRGEVTDFTFVRSNDQARQLIGRNAPPPQAGRTLLEQYPMMRTSPLFAAYQQALRTRRHVEVRQAHSLSSSRPAYHVVAAPIAADMVAVSFLELRAAPIEMPIATKL